MAEELDQFLRWRSDIDRRVKELEAFAAFCGGSVQKNHFVWQDGRYVLLHYDLMTIAEDGEVDRDDAYQAIYGVLDTFESHELSESAYLVRVPAETTSERFAAEFWNALSEDTAGVMREGDAVYVHCNPNRRDLIGGIAQVVPADCTSLITVRLPGE